MSVEIGTSQLTMVIKFKGEIDAGVLGSLLVNTSRMYKVYQRKIESNTSLKIRHISNGSIVVHFAGDPNILNHIHDFWKLIEGNAIWDIIKRAFGVVGKYPYLLMSKALTRSNLNIKEITSLTKSATSIMSDAAKNNYDIIIDFNNNKIILLEGSKVEKRHISKEDDELMHNLIRLDKNHINGLPSRSARLKRTNRKKND